MRRWRRYIPSSSRATSIRAGVSAPGATRSGTWTTPWRRAWNGSTASYAANGTKSLPISGSAAAESAALLRNDRDSAAGLKYRVLYLIEALEPGVTPCCHENVVLFDSLSVHPVLVYLPVLHHQDGDAIEDPVHAAGSVFPQRHHDIESDQRDDKQKRVRDGVVIGYERLLDRFTDDQQQNEIECRYLRNRTVSREPEHEQQEDVHGRCAEHGVHGCYLLFTGTPAATRERKGR